MADDIAAGDVVQVTYSSNTSHKDIKVVEGILLPRVDILEKDITVIKLNTGYNIGIANNKIKQIVLVKRYERSHSKQNAHTAEKKSHAKLPTVSVLSFGGTISSKIDYRTGGVNADYTAEDFLNMCPELRHIADIQAKKVLSIMSEDATWENFAEMATAIHKEAVKTDIDGIVVTCGTDVLHYISAAIAFFLKDLNKPVVVTASQRSIDRGSSDAFMNLSCAVTAAARWDGSEVVTCLHGSTSDDYCILIRGTKVRKMHTSRRDAFRPINEKAFAKIYLDGTIEAIQTNHLKRSDKVCRLDAVYDPKVAQILAYPGQDPEIIDFYVKKGYNGIVIAATALGHVATNNELSLIPGIKNAISKNVPVIIASQTIYGRTHPHVYTNLRKLSIESGCIFAEDILPEVAYIKLGYVLGHTKEMDKIQELMQSNLRGEINPRLLDDDFLY